jgi:hypothetical protein
VEGGTEEDLPLGAVVHQQVTGVGVEVPQPVAGGTRRIGEAVPVLARVHVQRDADLAEIAGALRAAGPFLGRAQGRQKHGGQDRNDGNDHQQFNQCEAGLAAGNLVETGRGAVREQFHNDSQVDHPARPGHAWSEEQRRLA